MFRQKQDNTYRDYIASQALIGILANDRLLGQVLGDGQIVKDNYESVRPIAEFCYNIADVMRHARDRQ